MRYHAQPGATDLNLGLLVDERERGRWVEGIRERIFVSVEERRGFMGREGVVCWRGFSGEGYDGEEEG